VFVAVSSRCFPDLSLPEMLERIIDLQFSYFEMAVHEDGGHLKPSDVHADLDAAIEQCRATRRLSLCALSVDIQAESEAEYYAQFTSCCRLAKASKVVTLAVRSAELGTPFNGEVERLRELVKIASVEGVVVGVKTEVGRMTEDPDTTTVLCNNVKGLGVTLDPSHFIYQQKNNRGFESILDRVIHVHLRDTAQDRLQVRVGQGQVEYGKLVNQLSSVGYNRALCVDILPVDGVDHQGELRKLRLLLESLLL